VCLTDKISITGKPTRISHPVQAEVVLGDCLHDRATALVLNWTELHISPSEKENVSQFSVLMF
jgi:hypothetical protein